MSEQQKQEENEKNEIWAVIQLMGHGLIAGSVRKSSTWGKEMISVTVPYIDEGHPEFTREYNPDAIFSMTYVSREVAHDVARHHREKAVTVFSPALNELGVLQRENARLQKAVLGLPKGTEEIENDF